MPAKPKSHGSAATNQEITPHTDRVSCVAVSPDGSAIATGSFDGRVLIWRADGGAPIRALAMPTGSSGRPLKVSAIAYDTAASLLAVGGEDGSIRLWRTATWESHALWQAHTDQIGAIAFIPASDNLVSVGFDGKVVLLGADDPSTIRQLAQLGQLCRSVSLTPDASRVAVGTNDGGVCILDSAEGGTLHTIKAHTNAVAGLAFLGGGDRLVSGGWDQKVRWWDLPSGDLVAEHGRHTGYVTSIAAEGGVVVSGSADGTLDVADAGTSAPIARLTDDAYWVHSVALFADRPLVVAGAEDNVVRLWSYLPARLVWSSRVAAPAIVKSPSMASKRAAVGEVDSADLYRHGDIVSAEYSFKGISLLAIQPQGRGPTRTLEIPADPSGDTGRAQGKRSAQRRSPAVQQALAALARLRKDRDVTIVLTTEDSVLEEGRVEGEWEGRSFTLGYRVHWDPGMLETSDMTVQDVLTLLERKELAEMEGDDFFGLSAHELRGGQTEFERPKWGKRRR